MGPVALQGADPFLHGGGVVVSAKKSPQKTSRIMASGSSQSVASKDPATVDPIASTHPGSCVSLRPAKHDSPAARLRAVARAFKKLEPETPGLNVGIKGSMTDAYRVEDPERGVVLAFQPQPGDAEVQLQVGPRGGRLVARSALKGAAGGVGQLQDHLRLDLRRGYRWGGTEYPDADAFTAALLAHMRRRHEAVAQVEPVVVEAHATTPPASKARARERMAQELWT